ncbi:MAG TPA: hypothetical protein VFF52_22900 [Isosphaeraceae bacterium]|nr:hypothetical protein [Isosphaeraceae bacterium]
MSGPIVRRYGFPNFEKIFGAKPLEHGVEEGEHPESPGQKAGPAEPKPEAPERAKESGTTQPKTS